MTKQKKTAEQAIKDGEFIALDKAIMKQAGISVDVILPVADYKKLGIERLMEHKQGAIEKLARAVSFTVFMCQRHGVKSDTVVKVLAKGFPALAMGVIPYNEKGQPVLVLSIAKKGGKSCKTK